VEGDGDRRASAVTDFSDIERFARAHAACGSITPNATTQMDGGYLLTLSCACGVSMDRWVTADEAKVPLSLSGRRTSGAAAQPPALPTTADEVRTSPATRSDLEEVMRRALEAEEAAEPRGPGPTKPAAPPPVAKPTAPAVTKPTTAPVAKTAASPSARPVPSTPAASSRQLITNLEDAVQRALESDARAAAPSAAPRTRERPGPPRLNADAAVQRAVDAQKIAAATAPSTTSSRFWFGALVVALIIAGVMFWLGLRILEEDARQGTREGAATRDAPAPPEARRAAFTEALRALKDVQAASTPGVPYSTYSSRVAFATSDVDRYLSTAAAGEAETDVRDAMDLHVLAVTAWKARTLDSKDAWEAVGQDPAIDRCPSARRVIDVTEVPTGQSRAYARGVGVAAAIPLLWECAGARVSRLDAAPSG
jgi:hypothetical protein